MDSDSITSVKDSLQDASDAAQDVASGTTSSAQSAYDSLMSKAQDVMKTVTTPVKSPDGVPESRVKELLYWRYPFISGIIFVFGNIVFITMLASKRSMLNIISGLFLLYFIIGFVVVNFSKFFVGFVGKDFIKKPVTGTKYIRPEVLEKHVPTVCEKGNLAIDEVKKAAYCTDNKTAFKIIGALFAIYIISAIPTVVLFYIIFLIAFIIPKIYELKKEEIDRVLVQFKDEYEKIKEKVMKITKQKYEEGKKLAADKSSQLQKQISEKGLPLMEKSGVAKTLGIGKKQQ